MKILALLMIIGSILSLDATPPVDESTIYWSPDKSGYDGKIKRDHNGDRI